MASAANYFTYYYIMSSTFKQGNISSAIIGYNTIYFYCSFYSITIFYSPLLYIYPYNSTFYSTSPSYLSILFYSWSACSSVLFVFLTKGLGLIKCLYSLLRLHLTNVHFFLSSQSQKSKSISSIIDLLIFLCSAASSSYCIKYLRKKSQIMGKYLKLFRLKLYIYFSLSLLLKHFALISYPYFTKQLRTSFENMM